MQALFFVTCIYLHVRRSNQLAASMGIAVIVAPGCHTLVRKSAAWCSNSIELKVHGAICMQGCRWAIMS